MFLVYFISGVAEINRAPFDVAEGESEIVAGFHVEYSGMAFTVFFLAEYLQYDPGGHLATIIFLGGWLPPVNIAPFTLVPGFIWLVLKVAFLLFCFLWFRATFPRYRYDQIMRLGWKVFIPITLDWIVLLGLVMQLPSSLREAFPLNCRFTRKGKSHEPYQGFFPYFPAVRAA